VLGFIAGSLALVGVQAVSASELDATTVTRVADNLYTASGPGDSIETQLCDEPAAGAPAVIIYPSSGVQGMPNQQGALYFRQSGQQCSVVSVRLANLSAPMTHAQQILAVAASMGWQPAPGASDPTQILQAAWSYVQFRQDMCAQMVGAPIVDGHPQWDQVSWANFPISTVNSCRTALSVTL
jgi:hypothetical protein